MKYEIVNLKEKILVGLNDYTSNSDPKMGEIISGLWTNLYEGGVSQKIKNKSNEYSIGLYSDYTDEGYEVTVGHEVFENENLDLALKIIPAGKYAKFAIHGNMNTVVYEAWNEIWNMDLKRTFTGDFEEYLNSDCENADINIYIAIE